MVRKIGTEALAIACFVLVGCRAVIGIEDLRRGDDASVIDDAAVDASLDTGADATADVVPPDGGGSTLATCNSWCRTDAGFGVGAVAFANEMRTCMCQGATLKACVAECGGLCPNGSPPSPACEVCMLQQVLDDGGVCASKAATCTAPCQGFVQCVKGCQ